MTTPSPVRLRSAGLRYGRRTLWQALDMELAAGEWIAVLGPNGSGKTSLLQILLGLVPLSSGTVEILGQPAGRANHQIGYIPQQAVFDSDLPIRGRDLVRLGLDGHRFGRSPSNAAAVEAALELVGAQSYADQPAGVLSGGEQQRLRVAQALVGQPRLLLCDEPLLSLDAASQQLIPRLLDDYRRDSGAGVLFVTHEIDPVLPYADRVLYFAGGHWLLDTPDVVLRSDTLSQLHGTAVDVVRRRGHVHILAETPAGQHHV